MTTEVRALSPMEWEAFRKIRLHALQTEAGVFASSYDNEVQKTPAEWQETIQGPDHQVFGLFDNDRLVGITACFTWREDPSGQTALLAMSYIEPKYRGRGFARVFYEKRLAWIRARPQFKRVVVSHRVSNDISRKANHRHGFVASNRTSRIWPDGAVEDEVFYELAIARGSSPDS